MENYSSKKLTKGLLTIRSGVVEIPKKTFCVGDDDTFTFVREYHLGYYVGSCFHRVCCCDDLKTALKRKDEIKSVHPDVLIIVSEIYVYKYDFLSLI